MPIPCSRRRALQFVGAAAATGLAGCLSGPLDRGETPTAEPVDVSFTATVEQSFTVEHPARITITFANDGDEPLAMSVLHGIEGPLSVIEGHQDGGDATLILLADPPEGDHETPPGAPCESGEYAIPDMRTDGCWRPACEIPRVTAHYAIPVAAGETLDWPYVVLDAFNDTCLPPGSYAFEETAPIALGQEASGATPHGGPTHYLNKRVTVDLAEDGTVGVKARVMPRSVPEPGPTEATEPATPREADD